MQKRLEAQRTTEDWKATYFNTMYLPTAFILFIGFELSKEYFDKAVRRIKAEQAQLTLF